MNKRMDHMMNKLMLTCKEATLLISIKSFRKLNLSEALKLRMHLMACISCRRFNRQNKIIDQGINEALHPEHDHLHRLSKEKKEELQKTISQSNKK
ncbi:MAG TPA: hypothetical protein VKA27_09825 [Sunxiuqinia sp.]|nr:hypothetical protein [Sunxiuqinia sp.]